MRDFDDFLAGILTLIFVLWMLGILLMIAVALLILVETIVAIVYFIVASIVLYFKYRRAKRVASARARFMMDAIGATLNPEDVAFAIWGDETEPYDGDPHLHNMIFSREV